MPLPTTYAGPGLVDLQVNGYAGVDFNAPPDAWRIDDVRAVAAALRRRGVVRALPTFITDEAERLLARARRYAYFLEEDPALARAFPKLHIEGPFIAPEDGPRGAHPRAHCRTPEELPDFLARLREASGDRIGVLTLAPELPGALSLITEATAQNICVALGHTAAPAATIRAAVQAGAALSTHLGNGSHLVLPRLDNYVQAQLAEDALAASFIADGHHLPPFVLKNFVRAKTPARSVLVTDAIAAADVGPGRYTLGGETVIVSEDLLARQPGRDHLAGSALTLDRAVLNAARWCGLPFDEAWQMASVRPARLAGLGDPPTVTVRVSESGFTSAADDDR